MTMPLPTRLLFLPGAGGSPEFWRPVADRLVHPASRRRFGWPGFATMPADPRVRGIDDLVELVVDGIDRPTALIAQSMGGVIALQAAIRRPDLVTHLVLTATSGGVDLSDLAIEDWRPAFRRANPAAPAWFEEFRADLSPELGAVRAPALLLWGDVDPISPVAVGRRLQSRLADSRLLRIPR